ncbi:hypothetical protein ZYGR_0AD06510 [Zygosaccharomyces rouxii]|uniref:Uncharacterized protein n=1 Tax=Zygosaccharomyces rouxii TaxID=4956 RepID=A0A1Q3A724_ZYGRO|nr:hypothetical protein ZYGR_0AD06510 [Zygosaccharomyces rouxii]
MDPFAYNKNLPNFKTPNDPALTLESNGTREIGSSFNNGDKDPTLFAIFDAPEHTLNTLNVFGNNELSLPLQEPQEKTEDFSNSYCTVPRSSAKLDDKDILLTDFDNSSSSPNSQSSKTLNASNNGFNNNSEYECSSLDNLIFEDMIGNGALAKSTPAPAPAPSTDEIMLECHTDAVERPLSRVSNSSFLIKSPTTQIKSPRKYSVGEKPFKIQKPKYYQNFNDLQNLISSYNMELNYILLSEDSDNKNKEGKIGNQSDNHNNKKNNTDNSNHNNGHINQQANPPSTNFNEMGTTEAVPAQEIPTQNFPLLMGDDQSIMESIPTQAMESVMASNEELGTDMQNSILTGSYDSTGTTTTTMTDDSWDFKPPKMNNSKVPRSRRTKCLKKDSTVSMEAKLEYFNRVVQSARNNKLRGIFLRDHAASELAIGKNDYNTMELNLINIDSISQTLEIMMQGQSESFRTIWKIFRQQYDHEVYLTFQLSDEYAAVNDNEMEISIFTLMVPGHNPKHLMTGCQYLQLVNFILGKEYNHLINDNLAETTVGSDGKMISTQKHHASRVRSHVKKYLKRHVVKDIKRYTNEERSNVSEFHYQMILHNLVMGCILKKPFESKVSVALMELPKVKDALIKQADFFVFKRI